MKKLLIILLAGLILISPASARNETIPREDVKRLLTIAGSSFVKRLLLHPERISEEFTSKECFLPLDEIFSEDSLAEGQKEFIAAKSGVAARFSSKKWGAEVILSRDPQGFLTGVLIATFKEDDKEPLSFFLAVSEEEVILSGGKVSRGWVFDEAEVIAKISFDSRQQVREALIQILRLARLMKEQLCQ